MEPLSALGLASAVAQLLDFGTKLFRVAREITAHGSSEAIKHVSKTSDEFDRSNKSLLALYEPLLSQRLTAEEQELVNIAKQSSVLSEEIISHLSGMLIEVQGEDEHSFKWIGLRAAFKTFLGQERTDILSKRISDYRAQLTLSLLVVLNTYQLKQSETLEDLRKSNQEIVEALTFQNVSDDKTSVIGAIFRPRQGSDTVLLNHRPETRSNLKDQRRERSQGILRPDRSIAFKARGSNSSAAGADFDAQESDQNIFQSVRDALHFRFIHQRQETITDAHKDTFEWIWKAAGNHGRWDNVSEWLKPGSGCYWISGKAGSGKSCLMRYVMHDQRTSSCLQQWASPDSLIVGSFYFWYAGTPLQKTYTGLLQSLLYAVLGAKPGLALHIFPDICRQLRNKRLRRKLDISEDELRVGFARLQNNVPKGVKICFIIDGIDEYIGDHNQVCDLLTRSKSESIKYLISSRPIPACIDRLSAYPKLRLQDLTIGDIEKYTRDTLAANSILHDMEEDDPGLTDKIVGLIVNHASGVFLWVVLVVRHLIKRLQIETTIRRQNCTGRSTTSQPTSKSCTTECLA